MRKKRISSNILASIAVMAVLYSACNQDLPCLENSRAFITAGLYYYDTNNNNKIRKDTTIDKIYIGNFSSLSALLSADSYTDAYAFDTLISVKGLRLSLDPLEDSTFYLLQFDTIYDYIKTVDKYNYIIDSTTGDTIDIDTIYKIDKYKYTIDPITGDTTDIDTIYKYTPLKRLSTDKLIFTSTREAFLVSYNCGFTYKHDNLKVDSNFFDYIKDIIVTKKEINPSDENEQVQIIF
jgi:hypothetical protein